MTTDTDRTNADAARVLKLLAPLAQNKQISSEDQHEANRLSAAVALRVAFNGGVKEFNGPAKGQEHGK